MYEVKVITEFSAAHSLREYKGKCEELHGHNWKVEAHASSDKLNKTGMVVDFKELKERLKNIISGLDHKHLNTLAAFKKNNPTSENIAKYIFDRLSAEDIFRIEKVTVWESSCSCASYYRK